MAPAGTGTLTVYPALDPASPTDYGYGAVVTRDGVMGPPQELPGPAYWTLVGAEGSALDGAVVAWTTDEELVVAELAPDENQLAIVRRVPASPAHYSHGKPFVTVGPGGDAAVVFMQRGWDTDQVMALIKPPGGEWGAPEPVAQATKFDESYARSVAMGPDGTLVVGLMIDGTARVATRPPEGTFELSEPVGQDVPEPVGQTPVVGIDAAGTVVVTWLEGAPTNDVGPIMVAFRPPGAETFDPPIDSGLRATDLDRIRLGVSAAGEVALVADTSRRGVPGEYTRTDGVAAAFGLSRLRRLGEPAMLSGMWGDHPSFDMNARGDAVVVWDQCCPLELKARRRPALGSFGAEVHAAKPSDFDGSRFAIDADLDEFGNARAIWFDGEVGELFTGWDLPLLTEPLPPVDDAGDVIPPVLEPSPAPEPPPSEPPPSFPPPVAPPATTPPPGGRVDAVAPRVRIRRATALRDGVRLRLVSSERAFVRLRLMAARIKGPVLQSELLGAEPLTITLPRLKRTPRKLRVIGAASDASGNVSRFSRSVRSAR